MAVTSWLGFAGGEEPRPVRELYGVFGRPRDAVDLRAEALAAVDWTGIDWGDEIDMSEGRVLLANLGGEQDTIYAAPLGVTRLVVAVLPNGGGGSGRPGPDGLFMLTSELDSGALVVGGLVADWVESVGVVVAGATHEARMGENAFGLRLDDRHEDDVERLLLHRRDGTTNAIELRPES